MRDGIYFRDACPGQRIMPFLVRRLPAFATPAVTTPGTPGTASHATASTSAATFLAATVT